MYVSGGIAIVLLASVFLDDGGLRLVVTPMYRFFGLVGDYVDEGHVLLVAG